MLRDSVFRALASLRSAAPVTKEIIMNKTQTKGNKSKILLLKLGPLYPFLFADFFTSTCLHCFWGEVIVYPYCT